jgi:hypothetical protein
MNVKCQNARKKHENRDNEGFLSADRRPLIIFHCSQFTVHRLPLVGTLEFWILFGI